MTHTQSTAAKESLASPLSANLPKLEPPLLLSFGVITKGNYFGIIGESYAHVYDFVVAVRMNAPKVLMYEDLGNGNVFSFLDAKSGVHSFLARGDSFCANLSPEPFELSYERAAVAAISHELQIPIGLGHIRITEEGRIYQVFNYPTNDPNPAKANLSIWASTVSQLAEAAAKLEHFAPNPEKVVANVSAGKVNLVIVLDNRVGATLEDAVRETSLPATPCSGQEPWLRIYVSKLPGLAQVHP